MRVDGVFVEVAKQKRIFEDSLHGNGKNVAQAELAVLRLLLTFLDL